MHSPQHLCLGDTKYANKYVTQQNFGSKFDKKIFWNITDTQTTGGVFFEGGGGLFCYMVYCTIVSGMYRYWYTGTDIQRLKCRYWYISTEIPVLIYRYWYAGTDILVLIYRYWFTGTDIQVLIYRYWNTGTDIQVLIYRYW